LSATTYEIAGSKVKRALELDIPILGGQGLEALF
jgi:hypothetical protein